MRLFLVFFLILGSVHAGQVSYLSSGGSIRVYDLDASSGELKQKQELSLPGAGPLRVSHDGRFLYAVAGLPIEGKKKMNVALATLKIVEGGKLEQVAIHAVPQKPGYLGIDATGTYLAGNSYRTGSALVWQIKDGIAQPNPREIKFEERAHSAIFSPDNQWLLVPSTSPNKVFINRFDAKTGAISPNNPPFASGPQDPKMAQQPRHLAFHPNGKFAFTTMERELPGVQAWRWDSDKGTLEAVQNVVTLPEKLSGRISTADVHVTPDGRFLFVSNRNLKPDSPEEDQSSIVSFSIDAETGKLTHVAHNLCESVPRSFCLDQTGKFLYVAGQAADTLGAYRIGDDGRLQRIAKYPVGKGPIWVTCHELK